MSATLSRTLTAVVDLVLPVRCAGCAAPADPLTGTAGPATRGARAGPAPVGHPALCRSCVAACANTAAGGPFPVHRPATAGGPAVYALADYGGVARTVVLAFKERGRRDLAEPLGRLLAAALPALPSARPDRTGTWWLVPAPSRATAARRRGGSHVARLAAGCARNLAVAGCPAAVAPALRLAAGARDSVGLDAAGRAANLARRLRLHPAGVPPPGAPVVLLDDVVTTGATVAACARLLAAAGWPVPAAVALTAAGGA